MNELGTPGSLPPTGPVGGNFWLPPESSTYAGGVDWLFYFVLYVSTFFFVLIVALMIFFVIRYRRRPGAEQKFAPSHSTALEVTWSVIPLGIVIFIFYHGFTHFMDMRTPPANAYDIEVVARQWSWEFKYPNGYFDVNLHVPVDRPVRLTLRSEDVIHSLYIPAFRQKMDAVPGRYTTTWFQATRVGTYDLYCAEYCGREHAAMLARVVVHPPGEFEKWLQESLLARQNASPVDFGFDLYRSKGCGQCHSTDGTARVGPTFKGIWGETHQFQNAPPAVVDENYIRESITDPGAKIRQGFQNQMPTYQGRLNDDEISAVIAFIKSLGNQPAEAPEESPAAEPAPPADPAPESTPPSEE